VAVDDRKLNIHEDEVGSLRPRLFHASLTVCGLHDSIARPLQKVAQNTPQIFLIIDNKDALDHAALLPNRALVGSSMWNVAPFPSFDSYQMRPPCISTICLAMARPRPVPPFALVFELSTW